MSKQRSDNGADAVFRTLLSWGVDRVFICPGSTEAAFLDASLDYPEVELILTAHEAVAVAMADGYARATGMPGVVYVHTHLGLANGLAHLSCAFLERSPVVVIAGIKARALHGADGFTTTTDVRSLPRQFVKWDWQTLRLEEIAVDLDRALRVATTGPPGPTFVAFPQDLLEAKGAVPLPRRPDRSTVGAPSPDPNVIEESAAMLMRAARPVVVLGGSATWPDFAPEGAALSAVTGAVLLLEDRRSITATAAPGSLTGYAGCVETAPEAVHEADLLLLAGARTPLRFEESAADGFQHALRLHLIEDPAEVSKGSSDVLPILGDVRSGLRDLIARCEKLVAAGTTEVDDAHAFRTKVCSDYAERLHGYQDLTTDRGGRTPIAVPSLMRTLVDMAQPGTLLVDDSVTSKGALLDAVLAPTSRADYVTTAGGSLGWGMAAAAGAAQAVPGTPVVTVVGDGVFQFGVQTLLTAVQERIALTYVVINNHGYAAVKAALRRYDGNAVRRGVFPAADLYCQDIVTIARGYGAEAHRVDTMDDLRQRLASPVPHGPVVIEVVTDPDDLGP